MKKTQEEHRPSAGDIADLTALPRDSGDVKALNSNALPSTGSLRAANPYTLNSRNSFARLTRQISPQPSTIGSNVGRVEALHGTPSDGEVPQQRGSVGPAHLGFSL